MNVAKVSPVHPPQPADHMILLSSLSANASVRSAPALKSAVSDQDSFLCYRTTTVHACLRYHFPVGQAISSAACSEKPIFDGV